MVTCLLFWTSVCLTHPLPPANSWPYTAFPGQRLDECFFYPFPQHPWACAVYIRSVIKPLPVGLEPSHMVLLAECAEAQWRPWSDESFSENVFFCDDITVSQLDWTRLSLYENACVCLCVCFCVSNFIWRKPTNSFTFQILENVLSYCRFKLLQLCWQIYVLL